LEFLETVFMDFNKVFRKMVMTFEIIDIWLHESVSYTVWHFLPTLFTETDGVVEFVCCEGSWHCPNVVVLDGERARRVGRVWPLVIEFWLFGLEDNLCWDLVLKVFGMKATGFDIELFDDIKC
jgi:hypothetical protein